MWVRNLGYTLSTNKFGLLDDLSKNVVWYKVKKRLRSIKSVYLKFSIQLLSQ